MNFFRPLLHIMIEPYEEYVRILSYRNIEDKSVIILQGRAGQNKCYALLLIIRLTAYFYWMLLNISIKMTVLKL